MSAVNSQPVHQNFKKKTNSINIIIIEADNIVHTKVKELREREYIKRLQKILKSKLNGGNTIKAINTWAAPVIRYPAGIIDWTQNELEELD